MGQRAIFELFEIIMLSQMLSISEISLSEAVKLNRFDAEYYEPSHLALDAILGKKETAAIGAFSTVTDGIHASIDFDENSNVNLLSAMSPKGNYFDISKNKCISLSQHKANPRTSLLKDDVIVSTVGTIGNCAVVDGSVLPANSDRHVGIIRIKGEFLPHYVSTFLLTKYGRFQTWRESTGNVQLNLFIEKLLTIKIPVAGQGLQKAISDQVKNALQKRYRSIEIYEKVEQDFLARIGLSGKELPTTSLSAQSLQDVLAVGRFDAEYWQPKYQEIEQRVAGVKQADLGDVVTVQKGVEAGSDAYKTEGKPFIRVSDFSIYGIDEADKYISDDLYAILKTKYQPRAGEVLFTKDGTIGITYAMHEDHEGIVSGAFLRLSPKIKLDIDYLALALNSMYCKSQIERMSGGAIIAHLKPDDAKRIKIPILSDALQQEMSREVSTALKLMRDSRKLLDEAKHALEVFVEQNEEAALRQFLR